MDMETLGAAVALMNKILPATSPGDAGMQLVVGADGHWVAGEATTASISVDGTTMKVAEVAE